MAVDGRKQWIFDASAIPLKTGGQYSVQCRGIDKTGNKELAREKKTFWFDDSAPENLVILINEGDEFTASSKVELKLHATDAGCGISTMAFSTDGSTWGAWKPFNFTNNYKLPEQDGEKKIYFRVQDEIGNIAEPVFDLIVLDTKPPRDLSVLINDGAKFSNSNIIKLTIFAIDDLSGVSEMSLSTDPPNWFGWKQFNQKG